MYPLKCTGGEEHKFKIGLKDITYVCSVCGITGEEYTKYDLKKNDLKLKTVALVDSLNGGSYEILSEAMFDVMHSTHRTLQQDFFRCMVSFINKMKDMPTDLRNQACVDWCKDVSKIEANFPRV